MGAPGNTACYANRFLCIIHAKCASDRINETSIQEVWFLGRINLQACNSTHKPVVRMFGPKLEGV